MSDYFHYISTSDYNFNITLLNVPEAVSLFDDIDKHTLDLQKHLNALPDLSSKDAFYLIGIFLIISHRQMRNAFFLFLRRMSYDGMLLFRVGLESAIFAYRIFKDTSLATVWALKNDNWKDFSNKFRIAEYPLDIPYRDEIKKNMDLLNNYWAHPNINYFSGSIVFPEDIKNEENKEIKVHFFDHKETNFRNNLIWFLDCCLKIIAIYRKILNDKFPILITSTEPTYQKMIINFENFKSKYKYE